jgi:hypothetical protein
MTLPLPNPAAGTKQKLRKKTKHNKSKEEKQNKIK